MRLLQRGVERRRHARHRERSSGTIRDLGANLIKLVNSAAVGGAAIHSLCEAIDLLGRKQLQRWLHVLLFTLSSAPAAEFPSPLLILAATRGKLMELIARALRPTDPGFQERAFITGISVPGQRSARHADAGDPRIDAGR